MSTTHADQVPDSDANVENGANYDADTPDWDMKLAQAMVYKQEGNAKFKEKAYKGAIGKYHRALLYLRGVEEAQHKILELAGRKNPTVPEETLAQVRTVKADCYNNLAACLLQVPDPSYAKVVQYCDQVLQVNPSNTKALFRKGRALYHQKDIDCALRVLKEAINLPDGQKDPNIKKYIGLCERESSLQDKRMKATYQSMFKKMAAEED